MYENDVWMIKNAIELNFKSPSVDTPDIVDQRIDLGFFQPIQHLYNMFPLGMIGIIELAAGNNYTHQSCYNKNIDNDFCKERIIATDCCWHGIPVL